KVDALIVMDLVEDDPRLPSLATLTRPVVLIGYPEESVGISCVDFDFLAGAMLAVRELHERGSRRIAMLTSPAGNGPSPTYAHRARHGYLRACQELGIEANLIELPADPESISDLVRDQLLGGAAHDGLFVHHEPALPMLGRALAALGVRVPEDVQVVTIAPEDVAENGPWEVSS